MGKSFKSFEELEELKHKEGLADLITVDEMVSDATSLMEERGFDGIATTAEEELATRENRYYTWRQRKDLIDLKEKRLKELEAHPTMKQFTNRIFVLKTMAEGTNSIPKAPPNAEIWTQIAELEAIYRDAVHKAIGHINAELNRIEAVALQGRDLEAQENRDWKKSKAKWAEKNRS